MKKWCCFIALIGLLSALVGCKNSAGGAQNDDKKKTKLGMAVCASADADEDEGSVDAVLAAVLTDTDGVILACRLDEIELKPSVKGGALQDVTDFRTKGERGDAYGMRASGAKQEWYQQAEAFCKYVVGKTSHEVAGIETADGKATDKDLSAGCTIVVTDFMKAVSDAAADAREFSLAASDKLGIAVSATRAADSEDTAPQYDLLFSAVTVDADGKVTGCVVDELQQKFSIENGRFAKDSKEVKTKKQLKDDYGMKSASGIGLEWYEQVENLQKYLSGKSTADIDGIPLTDGKATDADLSAGCTIAVTDMLKTVQKAMKNAA